MKFSTPLVIFLVLLSGCLLLHPQLSYQTALSQGDHGRDLYAFSATMHGDVPYRDYWWVYGPLMPYYYAAFLKIFGTTISSVLLGKFLLNLAAGCFFFLILRLFIPSIIAYAGSLWFWTFRPEFFFTYNHIGGITILMGIVYLLCLYIKNNKTESLFLSLLCAFLLSLVKVNFGLAALFVIAVLPFFLSRLKYAPPLQEKGQFLLSALCVIPIFIFVTYIIFLKGLTVYEIRQCLPYLTSDHPYQASILTTIKIWWHAVAFNININWANRIFAAFLIWSIASTLISLANGTREKKKNDQFIAILLLLILFYIINMHEYFVSGVLYRTYWAKPFNILLIFIFIGHAMMRFSHKAHLLLLFALFTIILTKYTATLENFENLQKQGNFIAQEKGQIYVGNKRPWINTVEETTRILKTTMKADEVFFALPYDPLYYFLSGKESPTRQLIFFEHINIPPEQEKSIIEELEMNRVNYILISSRKHSGEAGLGILGETYCPIIGKYIFENFTQTLALGDWVNHPGWAWNHGTVLLKRKVPY